MFGAAAGRGGWARGGVGMHGGWGSRRRLGPMAVGAVVAAGPERLGPWRLGPWRGFGRWLGPRLAAGPMAAGAGGGWGYAGYPYWAYGYDYPSYGYGCGYPSYGYGYGYGYPHYGYAGGVAGAALSAVTLGALGTAGYGPGWW